MKGTAAVLRSWRAKVLALLAIAALAVGVAAALAAKPAMNVSSCNSQDIGNGTVYWTSAFKDEAYTVGEVLTVVLMYSSDAGSIDATEVRYRAKAFSPAGTEGTFTDAAGTAIPQGAGAIADGAPGGQEPSFAFAEATCTATHQAAEEMAHFYFKFTKLPAKVGNKPNQKGNAQVNVHVKVGGQDVKLGTNIHVLTGPDQT